MSEEQRKIDQNKIRQSASNDDIQVTIENKAPSLNERVPYKSIVNDSGYVDLISNSNSLKNVNIHNSSNHLKAETESSSGSQSHRGAYSPSDFDSPSSSTERSLQGKISSKPKQLLSKLNTPCKKVIFVSCCVALGLIFMAGILLLILYGIIPCAMTACHKYASECVNHAFYAECICDYGYAGNGKEYCDECGVTYRDQNARVVGGVPAEPNSWPAQVLVMSNYKTNVVLEGQPVMIEISFMCGGTLVNRKTVLTAGHCVVQTFDYNFRGSTYTIKVSTNQYYPTLESMYRIYIGLHDKNDIPSRNMGRGVIGYVEKINLNPNYDGVNILNDLALLTLTETVDLNENIQVACLPNAKWSFDGFYYPPPNTPAWTMGWGTLEEGGDTPSQLHNVKIYIYNSTYCRNVIVEDTKNWDAQICAGDYANGGRDTCQGDSGGGLYTLGIVNNKLKFILAGMVSYGEGCGQVNRPGIYTRTSHYIDWILENSDF